MALKDKHTIMVVDDEISITKALHRLFRKHKYHILVASSGQEGLELLKKSEKPVSLIISDQRMPKMTGAQFLERAKKIYPDAIRFLLTGYSEMDAIVDAINKGEIQRYLTKPWDDDDLLLQVRQALEHCELVSENKRLEGSLLDTIKLLSSLVETINPTLGKHMKQVASLSKSIAEDYKLTKEELDHIEMAGMVHDIGLLGIPDQIILKNAEDMTQKEFMVFSQHPAIGSVCLESVEHLQPVAKMVLYHHEHYDGSGFPHNLIRDEIPLGSRIICVVADYFKIINTWPQDVDNIVEEARKHFGPAARNIKVTNPGDMLEGIAKKIILLSADQKYDMQVVSALMKKLGERKREEAKNEKKILMISSEHLKEGMVLAKNLRSRDGRILVPKGAKIKESSLETIKDLIEDGVIEKKICVILTTEQIAGIRKKTIEDLKNNKKLFLLSVEELKEGMALAKNLRSQDGRILVPKGTKLVESTIKSIQGLEKRGVIQNKIPLVS